MRKIAYYFLALALGMSLYGLTDRSPAAAQELSPIETLGKAIFFDTNLSTPPGQSCASCHAPEVGFTGPDPEINALGAVEPGAVPDRFGNRKPPNAAYAGESPDLFYDPDYNLGMGSWIGGMFWDGRATGWSLGDPLAEQAMGPFLNPLEMNMPGKRQVCIRVAHSDYAPLFEEVWGPGSLDFVKDPEGTYERIAFSIAAYERSAEANPFTSKFDLFWNNAKAAGKDITQIRAMGIPGGMGGGGGGMGGGGGGMGGGGMGGGGMGGGGMGGGGMGGGGMGGGGMGGGGMGGGGMGGGGMGGPQNNPARWEYYKDLGFSDEELQGLAVFNDSRRGNCASCHSISSPEGSDSPPLLTDFSYHNLGIPKNPDNPFYTMPRKWNPDGANWVDKGLGGFLMASGEQKQVYEPEMGKFKTPTLRNVDLRPYPEFVKAYGHNGFFKNLDQMDGIIHFYAWRAMMDTGGMGGGGMGPNPNMFPPPELDKNRIQMQPFNFMMDGAKIMAFLRTLSDGYQETSSE